MNTNEKIMQALARQPRAEQALNCGDRAAAYAEAVDFYERLNALYEDDPTDESLQAAFVGAESAALILSKIAAQDAEFQINGDSDFDCDPDFGSPDSELLIQVVAYARRSVELAQKIYDGDHSRKNALAVISAATIYLYHNCDLLCKDNDLNRIREDAARLADSLRQLYPAQEEVMRAVKAYHGAVERLDNNFDQLNTLLANCLEESKTWNR